MNPLLFVLPVFAAYLVFRAFMHKRSANPKWFAHYLVVSVFVMCIFFFELWMYYRGAP